MKILVVGGGGREHALAWKARQSKLADQVFIAPGNAGTALEPGITNVAIAADDIDALLEFALAERIDLTIVGPEAPLVNGIVDRFEASQLMIFGPSAAAAQLEGSKTFSKDFLARHNIPTAAYQSFIEVAPACDYAGKLGFPVVVKADGLAAGKGVLICPNKAEADAAIEDMLSGNSFGDAGHRVVVEEFLRGEEASFICIVDGGEVLSMATSQDHKARDNGDQGPNTGGMGAYSPAPIVTAELENKIIQQVILPTVQGMESEGARYRGFLYAGIMIGDDNKINVLEFNCRFGDPETQPILMRLRSDLIELCLAACQGSLGQQVAEWEPRAALGVVMAANGYPDSYASGEIIEAIPAETEMAKVFHAGTRIDEQGNIVTSGGRVLCAVALGDNIAQAQQQAYQLVEQIKWDNAYLRTDIGFKAIR